MSRRDDINQLYTPVKQLDTICTGLFIANFVFSVIIILWPQVAFALLIVQTIVAVLYVLLNLADDGILFFEAESARRKNCIQDALCVQLSELETEGYYNNSLTPSLVKYALNTLENSFFSKFIAKKMLPFSFLKTILSLIVIILSGWFFSDKNILLIIAQAVFSAYVIEDTFILCMYVVRMEKLYDNAYSLFLSNSGANRKLEAWLLSFCVEYECIKAHYKVRLDSNTFNKYNSKLSEQWESIAESVEKALDIKQ